jgi:hypothetical protein
MLTPGEFVVNAESARRHLPLLQRLNNIRGGRHYRAKAMLDDAGIPITRLQNSVYPARQSVNLRSRGGSPVTASSYLDEFSDPNVFVMANAVLKRSKLPALTPDQHKNVNAYLRKNIDPSANITEAEFGRHLTKAYLGAGVTRDQLRAISARNTMRFQFPGTGSITQRRDNLISTLSQRYPGAKIVADPKNNNNIIVNIPGQKSFKIEHEATRPLAQQGASYETLRQSNPAGSRGDEKLSYAHLPLDETLFMNMGGMVPGYNAGGMVPSANGQKYNMGGMVQGYNRGGMVRGLLGASAVGIGGQMLGQQVGGGLGSAITMGSYLASSMIGFGGMGGRGDQKGPGFMSRQLDRAVGPETASKLKTPIGPLNSLSTASKGLAGNLGGVAKMFGPLLKGFSTLLRLTSPLGLAITGVTAAIGFFIKAQKEKAAALETGRQAFGMDAEAAEKAGFKYTDYNAKIKEAIEDAKALKERNMMIYESMTKANVPINMTIEQYKKLKEEVKSTMGSYIDLFSQTERRDVGQVATQLKAQFMAAGDSAEVATAKIFTMIKQSENANMAASAISSNAFQSIQNMEQASAQTVKTFEAAMKTGDAESQARALHTTFMAMDATLEETILKQKKLGEAGKASADEVGNAIEDKLVSINKSFGTQANLSKDVINELGKTDPLLAEMLNNTDTLSSAWAKYRLIIQGVSLDFESMSGEAAIAALSLNEIVKAQVQLNPSLAAANKSYKNMTDRIKELEKAQKGQSVKAQYNAKEESKRLQDQIAEIKKAAQEKINGIRKATEAENTQLEIQKAQLRASQALIQGNMSQYAEEQMTVEQLMNEANRKDAEEAIIAKAEIDVKPLQDALDAMADKNEKMAKKAALAGESLSSLQSKANDFNTKLQEYTTNLNNTMFKYLTDVNFKNTKEYQAALEALDVLGKKLGIKTPAKDVVSELTDALKNGINAQDVTIYTDKINDGKLRDYQGNDAAMSAALKKGGASGDVTKAYSGGVLTDDAKKAIMKAEGLEPGDEFIDTKGRKYKVKDKFGPGHQAVAQKIQGVIPAEMSAGRFMGGRIVPGIPYTLNDGGKVEGIRFDNPGMVYPNAATMPRFNVPSGTKYNGVGPSNTSSSSNVYNIDIDLNGTTVTADDVLNSFKRELALINAKEGISRRVGA